VEGVNRRKSYKKRGVGDFPLMSPQLLPQLQRTTNMTDVKYAPLKQDDLESGVPMQQQQPQQQQQFQQQQQQQQFQPHQMMMMQQQQPVGMSPMVFGVPPPSYAPPGMVPAPVMVNVAPPPSTSFVPALLATFCCFLPFGIVALIYAVRAKVRFFFFFLIFFLSENDCNHLGDDYDYF